MMAGMDDGVGRIRTRLRELGLEQNTLVLFIGDNGAPLKEGAWNGSLNLPLTGEKGMLTDGGVRVPFVAAWPGTLPAGKTYDHPVIALDVAATATALAGLPADPALDGVNLMPFLLGQKNGSPHDALYWRWRSQAAVRTDRWKLIFLGGQKFLFDLKSPETETKNRLADFPDVAAELEKKLLAWNATLPPPGLPRELNAQDQIFFDAHVNKTGATVVKRGAEKGSARKGAGKAAAAESTAGATQGWLGRNCTLTVRDGALQVAADSAAKAKAGKPFLTHAGLDLSGPVKATVQLHTRAGGTVGLAWRTAEQPDFTAENNLSQAVAGSPDWQTITLTLPSKTRVIHVRLHLPGGEATAIRRIELRAAGSEGAKTWDFSAPPP
jgi:uncharacterized sulfatase